MSVRYTSSGGRACRQRDHITIEHHFQVDIFTIIWDSQLQELNNRFKEDVMELLILSSTLDPRDDYNSFKIEDICKLANQFYPNHFIEQEKIHLKFQLQNYEIDILKHPNFYGNNRTLEVNATTKPSTDNVEASIPEQHPCKVPRIESKEVYTSSLKVNSGKNCAFLTHIGKDPNSSHRIVIKSCHDLTIQAQHIEKLVEKQTSQQVAKNRLWLKTTIDAVKWLTFQACAFKGRDEGHDSNNRENVIELIKLLASYNADVEDVLHKAPQNASYYSHRIQKEILSIFFFDKIQRFIREEIDEAKFCVIVDEARDESKREQMSIVLRFVDKDGFIKEHFFDIVHVSDTTSATLKEEICIVLYCHNLSVQNIRGQGYDGASNMRGEWTGLQALFLHDCHFAYYVHCFAHRLQLALVATAREAEEIAAKLAIYEVETSKVLSNVNNDGATFTQRADADEVYDKITSFEIVFILHLMRDILRTTNDLCQALQCKSQDILNAMHIVLTTKALVEKYREDGWISLLENVQLFCGKYDIDIPDMSARYTSGRGRVCHQRDHVTIKHHFRVDIFTIICDSQLQELSNRFKEDVMELLILSSALDPRDDYSSFKIEDVCKLANQFYPNDFTEQEKIHLKFQLQNYEIDILKHPEFQQLLTIFELCQMLATTRKSTIYPLVDRLICLVLTLPISTATTKRAFSAMKIVKTRLRNRMENDFLSRHLLTYVEKDIARDFDEIPS
ncbi:zinc finger MYM-type protein 1-like [Camellia sinensis]|uniref:zinc finger MYM-type protein 1-like n=1 Tax=Camellia sinensis TaxID=4442 RepID=UPI0010357E95|nr:zinc finger MYM-type protein 1-like [Camellia sinensis]